VGLQLFQDGAAAVELLGLVLGEPPKLHRRAQLDPPLVGRQGARHHLEQGGLARPVLAHDGPALAPPHQQAQVAVDAAPGVGLAHALDLEDLVPAALDPAEVEAPLDEAAGRLDPLDLVHLLGPALHLAGLGGLGLESLDEAQVLGQGGLLLLVLGLALGGIQRPRPLVGVVVARVRSHLSTVDLDDAAHHAVHHVAVVAGQQDGARVVAQPALQPDDALDVQVVGGLVQQQQLGAGQQQAGELHAHPPAAGQRRHGARQLVLPEAQAVQDRGGAGLQVVTPARGELALHLAVALDHLVVVRRLVVAQALLQPGQLLAQGGQRPGAGQGLLQHAARGQVGEVLPEPAGRQAPGPLHRALVGALLAQDQAEQGGLASPVGADQADLLAGVELHGRAQEDDLVPVLQGDVAQLDHGRGLGGGAR
jgi:hypothetical protein